MEKLKIEVKPIPGKAKKAKIHLIGELSINTVNELKNELLQSFEMFNSFEFVCKKVQSIDLSSIQVIFSFKQLCGLQSKEVVINDDFPEDVRQLVIHSGFQDILNFKK